MRLSLSRFPPAPAAALALSALLIPAAPPAAQAGGFSCESLWYLRNLIAHRAGFCFATPLGEATFGNAGCIAGAQPAPDDAARMQAIAQVERFFDCAVDTDTRRLDAWVASWDWARIETVPTAREVNASCVNYRGPALVLRAAPDAAAPPSGMVRPGDGLGIFSEEEEGWIFVRPNSEQGDLGWVETTGWYDVSASCEMWLP